VITRLKKEKQVKHISDCIQRSKAGFLVDFQGLNVQQVTEMRKELRNKDLADMRVCRNSLISKALENYPEVKEHFNNHLTGSNAFVFAFEDPVKVAKILSDYVKKTDILKIKTGVLEGKGMSKQDISMLATLPSIEGLKSQFLSVLSAPLSKLLFAFSAAPQGLLRVLSTYKDKNKK